MKIDAWQVPLLVMAGIILLELVLGPSLADQLASVAAAMAAVVALWLTYRSYRSYPAPGDRPAPSDVDDQAP